MHHYLTILLLLFASVAISQSSYDLEGVVLGDDEAPLMSATVVLLNQADSTLLSFGLTDDKGRFKIMDVAQGKVIMQVTFLGYEQQSIPIDINESFNPKLPAVQLSKAEYALEEVEILSLIHI